MENKDVKKSQKSSEQQTKPHVQKEADSCKVPNAVRGLPFTLYAVTK